MATNENDGLLYLQMCPKLWKWMNRCLSCGHLGHKPELPDQIGDSIAAQNIRKYFKELPLNSSGQCPQCSRETK